jgi:hypothetical protein
LSYSLCFSVSSIRQEVSRFLGRLWALLKSEYSQFLRWLFPSLSNARPDRKSLYLTLLQEVIHYLAKERSFFDCILLFQRECACVCGCGCECGCVFSVFSVFSVCLVCLVCVFSVFSVCLVCV